jgi:hypothetical protein
MAGMGPVCVWGGVGWVPLGGPAGGLTAGIGGCLQGAVGMACVSLGGQLGRCLGSATCHGPGGGVSCMGWATTSCDVAGRGRLFCVGGSIVVDGLELLG